MLFGGVLLFVLWLFYPVQTVFLQSCLGTLVLFCLGSSIPADPSWLSCPSILSWLPCPDCLFLTVPSRLSCSVSSVLLSFHDCLFVSRLSFPSCLVLVVVVPLEIFLRKLSHN
jgi:hypothetical protein